MGVPLDVKKHGRPVVLTAANMLEQRRKLGTAPRFAPPEAVILCYQPALVSYGRRKQRGKRKQGFFGDFYLLEKTGRRVGLAGNFGVGAPVTAVLLEDLAAFGVKRFISIGVAGGVQDSGRAGDLVVAERALRDEGTSQHYLPPGRWVQASQRLFDRLERALEAAGATFVTGTSWTTDAPYRETVQEHREHLEAGVLTVEMEAAALYAVAQLIEVEACAAFCIGDRISDGRWQPQEDETRVQQGLQRLFDAAIMALMAN